MTDRRMRRIGWALAASWLILSAAVDLADVYRPPPKPPSNAAGASGANATTGVDGGNRASDPMDGNWGGIVVVLGLLLVGVGIQWWRLSRGMRAVRGVLVRYRVGGAGMGSADVEQTVEEMDHQITSLLNERNQLQALLSSMQEGVLAIDSDRCVLRLNEAAARLLGIDPVQSIGQNIAELLTNPALPGFIAKALTSPGPVQADLEMRPQEPPAAENGSEGGGEATPQPLRYFRVQGAELRDEHGLRMGVLIVLHDITRLVRLEVIRTDFVANASHEIKTPVTTIKAAAETLLEAENQDPEDTQRFLQIISRQSDRLKSIIEDLLSLARLEQEGAGHTIKMEEGPLAAVLQEAAEAVHELAGERRTELRVECQPGLRARMNAQLMEQALVNLLANAIKYSPSESLVELTAKSQGMELVIAVKDNGPGIEPIHLPRIFERFYRTDKARSRSLGGTGLGLAIVKHIAQVHSGKVSVTSAPGRGSTFRIHLPTA